MNTINAIIERLRKERGSVNGCYYLLQTKVVEFQEAIAAFKTTTNESTGSWFRKGEVVTETHSILDGFFNGLYAASFITDAEKNQAFKELNTLRWPPETEAVVEKEAPDVLQNA